MAAAESGGRVCEAVRGGDGDREVEKTSSCRWMIVSDGGESGVVPGAGAGAGDGDGDGDGHGGGKVV